MINLAGHHIQEVVLSRGKFGKDRAVIVPKYAKLKTEERITAALCSTSAFTTSGFDSRA